MVRIAFRDQSMNELGTSLRGVVEFHHFGADASSKCNCEVSHNGASFTPAEGQGALPIEMKDRKIFKAMKDLVYVVFMAKTNNQSPYVWTDQEKGG